MDTDAHRCWPAKHAKHAKGMNSREKGKRGERQWRDVLRAHGYMARRGQQFAGSPDSPDVVCDELKWAHFEVKNVEHLNVYDGMEQAERDAMGECRRQNAERGTEPPHPKPSPTEPVWPPAERGAQAKRARCRWWFIAGTSGRGS